MFSIALTSFLVLQLDYRFYKLEQCSVHHFWLLFCFSSDPRSRADTPMGISSWLLQITTYRGFQLHTPASSNGTPLQYSCLENPMDGGVWRAAVHEVAKSPTRLSDFPFTFHFHALEQEMATHSSVLAWRIPGTGEPGGLLSMGLHRVGHD